MEYDCAQERFGRWLDPLAEVLTPSTFPQEEIDRQKQSIIASIKARREPVGISPRRSARRFIRRARTGGRSKGSEASVKGTGTAKPESLLRALLSTQSDYFVGGGRYLASRDCPGIERSLRSWPKGEPATAPVAPSKVGTAETLRVNKELTQANIILGHEGVGRENPDYYAIQVMNYILGAAGFPRGLWTRSETSAGGLLGLQLLQR